MFTCQFLQNLQFQSSPLIAEGCCPARLQKKTKQLKRFNPHPSLLRGAAFGIVGHFDYEDAFQSSPLIAEGCCKLVDPNLFVIYTFQSSPLIAEGCCYPRLQIRGALRCFNPHPSLLRGAAPAPAGLLWRLSWFQSSPLIAEGCCKGKMLCSACAPTFQSSPLIAEGCCGWRHRPPRATRCFNPHPSLLRGAALKATGKNICIGVSILTPHC